MSDESIVLEGKTVRAVFDREGASWSVRFSRDDGRVAGSVNLDGDLYGWIRADGFAPGRVRRIEVAKGSDADGDVVNVDADVEDKNGHVWTVSSAWRIEAHDGAEVFLERRRAGFLEEAGSGNDVVTGS